MKKYKKESEMAIKMSRELKAGYFFMGFSHRKNAYISFCFSLKDIKKYPKLLETNFKEIKKLINLKIK